APRRETTPQHSASSGVHVGHADDRPALDQPGLSASDVHRPQAHPYLVGRAEDSDTKKASHPLLSVAPSELWRTAHSFFEYEGRLVCAAPFEVQGTVLTSTFTLHDSQQFLSTSEHESPSS